MLEADFTQLALNKIDFEQQYAFFHETDIGLNEIYTYVNAIFDQEDCFLAHSKHNATHLQSVSQHPNIKDGKLFMGTKGKKVLAIVIMCYKCRTYLLSIMLYDYSYADLLLLSPFSPSSGKRLIGHNILLQS